MHEDTTVSPPRDLVALLTRVRQRIRALVEPLGETELRAAVPMVEGLDLHGLVAHVAGAATDAAEGRARPEPSCGQATAHAAARRGAAVPELLCEWDVAADKLSSRLGEDRGLAAGLLADAVTHEHDLRTVLDLPGHRDDESVLAVLDILSDGLSERVVARGLPALRITVEQWGTIAGRGPALRCLVADRFDFVRGMSGRRSARQVERWNWDTTAGDYLDVLSATGALAAADVRERDPRVPDHMQDFDLRH